MPRIDRDFSGAKRVSQTEILKASIRDDHGQVDPPKPQSDDMNWDQSEPESGPLSVKLGDLFQKRPG